MRKNLEFEDVIAFDCGYTAGRKSIFNKEDLELLLSSINYVEKLYKSTKLKQVPQISQVRDKIEELMKEFSK